MENAGKAAAQFMIDNLDINNKNIVIICGKGNNGGDGYVIARYLSSFSENITIILASGEPSTEDSIIMFARSHDIKHIYYKKRLMLQKYVYKMLILLLIVYLG